MRIRRDQTPAPSAADAQHEEMLTLAEVCGLCDLGAEELIEMVEEGLVEPFGGEPRDWRFPIQALRPIRTACRLRRDLRVNLRGAALAVELIEEIRTLRTRVSVLERQLGPTR